MDRYIPYCRYLRLSRGRCPPSTSPWLLVSARLFSKKLSSSKSKYFVFDRELLAAYFSIHHFRFLLECGEFTVFTDHKPLMHALFGSSPLWSALVRILVTFPDFTSDIDNVV